MKKKIYSYLHVHVYTYLRDQVAYNRGKVKVGWLWEFNGEKWKEKGGRVIIRI